MKIILSILLLLTATCASKYDKYLKNQNRAEVKAEKLISEGYYTDANEFLVLAIDKFPNNPTLYAYYGKSFYQIGNLESAKINFMLSLKIDPTNELSSGFVKLINEQEAARANEAVEAALEYLSNKGLDFLLIFLAFLGGDVIAKRYTDCNKSNETFSIKAYNTDISDVFKKIKFLLSNIFSNFSFICGFLTILILVINALAFSIVVLWLELSDYIPTPFLIGTLDTVNYEQIMTLTLANFSVIIGILILLSIHSKYKRLDIAEDEIADQLQSFALSNQYSEVRESLLLFKNNQKGLELIIDSFVSEEAKNIVEKIKINLKGKK